VRNIQIEAIVDARKAIRWTPLGPRSSVEYVINTGHDTQYILGLMTKDPLRWVTVLDLARKSLPKGRETVL
jgi:hypothetical protein